MDIQFLTMLTGFIAILFTIVNSNNSVRAEINSLRKDFKDDLNREISRLDLDIKSVNAKLDTLIMAL